MPPGKHAIFYWGLQRRGGGAVMLAADKPFTGRKFLAAISVLTIGLLVLSGCAPDTPPKSCDVWDFDCFSEQAIGGMRAVRENLAFWTRLNLAGQIAVGILSLVATVTVAMQTEDNKRVTRPVSVVSTALVTGITALLLSLQVPETIDRLVDALGDMATETNKFMYSAEILKAGRDKDQLKELYHDNAAFRDAVIKLSFDYAGTYNKLKLDLFKLGGATANLRVSRQPPPPNK